MLLFIEPRALAIFSTSYVCDEVNRYCSGTRNAIGFDPNARRC